MGSCTQLWGAESQESCEQMLAKLAQSYKVRCQRKNVLCKYRQQVASQVYLEQMRSWFYKKENRSDLEVQILECHSAKRNFFCVGRGKQLVSQPIQLLAWIALWQFLALTITFSRKNHSFFFFVFVFFKFLCSAKTCLWTVRPPERHCLYAMRRLHLAAFILSVIHEADGRAVTVRVHHHHHQSLNREGRWGTTDDFATSFLHFSLWDLPNSRLVHSLILSSHLLLCLPCLLSPFTVPYKMVLARPDERETWPRPVHSMMLSSNLFLCLPCLLPPFTVLC